MRYKYESFFSRLFFGLEGQYRTYILWDYIGPVNYQASFQNLMENTEADSV